MASPEVSLPGGRPGGPIGGLAGALVGGLAGGLGTGLPGKLTKRAEFLHVAAKGRKVPVTGLVLQVLARQDTGPVRLGFTVTKKVGNSVVRNRTKRRLREAARLLLRETPVAGADLVLIGRDKTRGRRFSLLVEDLRQALARTGLPRGRP
jgi:ribonuclease P protein component